MKKLVLFAMLIIASIVAFAAQEKSNEPQKFNLKTEIVDAAQAAPANEVVKSIDYLVEKYSTTIVDNPTTKIIAKEAVQKQVMQAQKTISWCIFSLVFCWLLIILALLPHNFWDNRDMEDFMKLFGGILLIITTLCTFVFFIYLPDLITQLNNPTYFAFKEVAALFLQ